jgi:hypothetical protein
MSAASDRSCLRRNKKCMKIKTNQLNAAVGAFFEGRAGDVGSKRGARV